MIDLFAAQGGALWLVNRLRQLGVDSLSLEAQAVREAITAAQYENVVAGRAPGGKGAEDFEACFARVFGEPLHVKKKRGRKV